MRQRRVLPALGMVGTWVAIVGLLVLGWVWIGLPQLLRLWMGRGF